MPPAQVPIPPAFQWTAPSVRERTMLSQNGPAAGIRGHPVVQVKVTTWPAVFVVRVEGKIRLGWESLPSGRPLAPPASVWIRAVIEPEGMGAALR